MWISVINRQRCRVEELYDPRDLAHDDSWVGSTQILHHASQRQIYYLIDDLDRGIVRYAQVSFWNSSSSCVGFSASVIPRALMTRLIMRSSKTRHLLERGEKLRVSSREGTFTPNSASRYSNLDPSGTSTNPPCISQIRQQSRQRLSRRYRCRRV